MMFLSFSRILNFFFGLIFFLVIVGVIIFYEYTKNLPSYDQIINYKPDATINIYAQNGEYLASLYREDRIVLKSDDIPQLIKNAIIAAEDRSFYENSGLDFGGIFRALISNVTSHFSGDGKIAGGSTITQQIIKNTMLSKEKTLKRKIQEARLAIGINKYLSKEEILERYINHIYLGNNSYGFAQASLNYLNKSIDDLTIEDAAFLAALPQAPSRMDPTRRENHERLINRRNWIIDQMLKQNFISQKEHDDAITKPIILNKKPRITQNSIGIEYAIDEIKKKLFELSGKDEDFLYQGGYTVHSTIIPELQKYTTYALRKGLVDYDRSRSKWSGPIDHFKTKDEYLKFLKVANKSDIYPLKMAYITAKKGNKITIFLNENLPEITITESNGTILKNANVGDVVTVFENSDNDELPEWGVDDEEKKKILEKKNIQIQQTPKVNGAIVVMDTHTGNVLALSGGFSYYKNQFNRATQALRQPGSAIKPLIYLTGLENGFTPYSILMDEPIEMPQGKGMPAWRPKNYGGSFAGPVTMQSSLERSRNLATLYLAREVGIDAIIDNSKKYGLMKQDEKRKNYPIVLGSYENTLLDMVRFYAIIANGGFDIKSNFIEYIQDRDGDIVWKNYNDVCLGCVSDEKGDDHINPIPPVIRIQEKLRMMKPEHNYQLLNMMEGVVKRGTGYSLNYLGGHIAGKTGTSNESKDVWFIGMTKDIAFGVYVGFDKPRSLGEKATGASVAIPFIKTLLEKIKPSLNLNDEFYSDEELKKLDLNKVEAPAPSSSSGGRKDDAYVASAKEFLDDYEVYYD
jgi:penicillin-binding protein 1A